jgi:hypothetical protein
LTLLEIVAHSGAKFFTRRVWDFLGDFPCLPGPAKQMTAPAEVGVPREL